MKQVVCLLNGITDTPLDDLGGVTPLQKAFSPHLDTLAQKGDLYRIEPPAEGGQEHALLALLGFASPLSSCMQGPLEAASLNIPLSSKQVVFSGRFISVGEEVVIDVSEDLVRDSEGRALARDVTRFLEHLGWSVHSLGGGRVVVVAEEAALPEGTSDLSFNPVNALHKLWYKQGDAAKSEVLSLVLQKVGLFLQEHDINTLRTDLEEPLINGLLLYHGGAPLQRVEIAPWVAPEEMVLLTPSPVSIGCAKLLGIDYMSITEEKKYDALPVLLKWLKEHLEDKEQVIIELNYLWNSTYNGDLLEKVKGIEYLDKEFIKPLLALAQKERFTLTLLPLRHTEILSGALLSHEVPCIRYNPDQYQLSALESYNEERVEGVEAVTPIGELLASQLEHTKEFC